MFKFTIREAILMTTIVAALLMWWMERNQNAKNHARLTAIEARLQSSTITVQPAPKAIAQGISITVHASSEIPYSQLNGALTALQQAGVNDITIANP